jgi:hypothetical protein
MRRVAGLVAATVVIAAGIWMWADDGADARKSRGPVAVGLAQREFHMTAYRRKVRRGPVKFNIANLGEDTHNLVIRGPKRFRANGPDVRSGERATYTVRLRRRGTYRLLCTRANHLSLGMRTRIRVR